MSIKRKKSVDPQAITWINNMADEEQMIEDMAFDEYMKAKIALQAVVSAKDKDVIAIANEFLKNYLGNKKNGKSSGKK